MCVCTCERNKERKRDNLWCIDEKERYIRKQKHYKVWPKFFTLKSLPIIPFPTYGR